MLMPIASKKPAKEAAAKKPARSRGLGRQTKPVRLPITPDGNLALLSMTGH
jgi:hypothetical protein